jgi:hypothetical protein
MNISQEMAVLRENISPSGASQRGLLRHWLVRHKLKQDWAKYIYKRVCVYVEKINVTPANAVSAADAWFSLWG